MNPAHPTGREPSRARRRSTPSAKLRVWPYFRRAIQPSLLLIAVGVLIRLLSDTPAPRQFGGLLALTGLGCTALTLLVFALLHWRRQL